MLIIDRGGTRVREVCVRCRAIHRAKDCPRTASVRAGPRELTDEEWRELGRWTAKALDSDVAAMEEWIRQQGRKQRNG